MLFSNVPEDTPHPKFQATILEKKVQLIREFLRYSNLSGQTPNSCDQFTRKFVAAGEENQQSDIRCLRVESCSLTSRLYEHTVMKCLCPEDEKAGSRYKN